MSAPATVLVIEDNPVNLKLVRDLLRDRGFRVIEATCAREGIALAREAGPDVILMDVGLPDIDGVRALGLLREQPRTRATPVAAVTAYAMKGDRERLLAAGFDGYIPKPVDVRALPGQVRELIAGGPA